MSLLSINNLAVGFPAKSPNTWNYAVYDVSLSLEAGSILGVVGESGCGKSLTSLSVLRLVPSPGKILAGSIEFEGHNVMTLGENRMRQLRGRRMALIPQDPLTSLNPVYTIGNQVTEVLTTHLGLSRKAADLRAIELLDQVRLPNAKSRLNDYPHQFSGGMRQRVMIAMALSCGPSLLIADEPTTALDVTVQAQILTLLQDIQRDTGMAILLITHDLGVVAEVCDRVAVMYAGRIVEEATVENLFAHPQHPYTQGLLSCIPRPEVQELRAIEGQPPAIGEPLPGCSFAPRCPQHFAECDIAVPAFRGTANHHARCLLVNP